MSSIEIGDIVVERLRRSQKTAVIVSDVDEVVLYHFMHLKDYLVQHRMRPFGFIHELHGGLLYESGEEVPLQIQEAILDDAYRSFSREQQALPGAVKFLRCLSAKYEVIFLTNVPVHSYADRVSRLDELGLPFPVIGNTGGKGRVVRELMTVAEKPFIFVDDSMRQIQNIRKHCCGVFCIHFTATEETASLPSALPPPDLRVYSWKSLYKVLTNFSIKHIID